MSFFGALALLIQKAGSNIAAINRLNFIEGSNVTITTSHNTGNQRVDVTIAATDTGETNTASNAGLTGVGLVETKSGVDLPFRSIAPGSNKVTVTHDDANNAVNVDVSVANIVAAITTLDVANVSSSSSLLDGAIVFEYGSLDASAPALSTGVKSFLEVKANITITGWTLLGDHATGSAVIDVWKDTYANYKPTVADTIAGSEKPTLSSANKNQDLTLTTWTDVDIDAGEVLGFNIDSVSDHKWLKLSLRYVLR